MDRVYRLYSLMHKSRSRHFRRAVHGYLRVVYGCDIMPETQIGEGAQFPHNGLGVVIHPGAIVGTNCKVCQCVTIGGRGDGGLPRVGENVLIGANSVILGGITIGDDAKIGAGSVVVNDVPAGAVAVGNPARIVTHVD